MAKRLIQPQVAAFMHNLMLFAEDRFDRYYIVITLLLHCYYLSVPRNLSENHRTAQTPEILDIQVVFLRQVCYILIYSCNHTVFFCKCTKLWIHTDTHTKRCEEHVMFSPCVFRSLSVSIAFSISGLTNFRLHGDSSSSSRITLIMYPCRHVLRPRHGAARNPKTHRVNHTVTMFMSEELTMCVVFKLFLSSQSETQWNIQHLRHFSSEWFTFLLFLRAAAVNIQPLKKHRWTI